MFPLHHTVTPLLPYTGCLIAIPTLALAGAQHTSKAKSWKLHSAGPPGMPHPAPPHPLSPSLGQGRLMAKSNIAPTAILKTGAPSGFDNPAEWTSDHLESGSIQASTARRRSESSQARMRKGVDLHTDQKHGASLVESESSQGRMRKGVHLHTDQKHGASLVESESSQGRVRKGVDVHSDPQSEPWTSPVGSSRLHTKVSWPLSAPILPPFCQFSWPHSALIRPPF